MNALSTEVIFASRRSRIDLLNWIRFQFNFFPLQFVVHNAVERRLIAVKRAVSPLELIAVWHMYGHTAEN